MSRPSNLLVTTTKRNQRLRGPTSSEQQNDLQAELVRDLTNIQREWNNKVVPLCQTIPDGVADSSVDAFLNGLDGQTLYVKADATNTSALATYYNTSKDRPNTVYEQFVNVYAYIDAQVAFLRSLIDAG